MVDEQTCYYCKFLCCIDMENNYKYICTISCRSYPKIPSPEDCVYFKEDREE